MTLTASTRQRDVARLVMRMVIQINEAQHAMSDGISLLSSGDSVYQAATEHGAPGS